MLKILSAMAGLGVALVQIEGQGQAIYSVPTTGRPPIEPAEQLLKRRGNLIDGPTSPQTGGTTIVGAPAHRVSSNRAEVIRLRQEATSLGESFGKFERKGPQFTYKGPVGEIANPVRLQGGELVVLGPEPKRGWEELDSVKVLNNLDEGLLVQIGELSALVRNYPRQASVLENTRISGWFRLCDELFTYRAITGIETECAVFDYGKVPSVEESETAIVAEVEKRKTAIDALNARADAIEKAERQAKDERIRRFREEQAAKRFSPVEPAPKSRQ